MTLSPVFRSPEAVRALEDKGYLDALAPALELQRESVALVRELLRDVIAAEYVADAPSMAEDIVFLQEQFFLTLFASMFRTVGAPDERLRGYALINICVKGLVTSGDNLFDDEDKLELPLRLGQGACFASIVQMLCFDSLLNRVLQKHCGFFSPEDAVEFRRNLLSRLTAIGALEGSEEGGVGEELSVEAMVERVHRVRGGELFALAFVAPAVGERGENADRWRTAESGVRHLGAAFQIVDDVTDFEFDLGRGSHNIVVAQITRQGTDQEKAALAKIRRGGARPQDDTLESRFSSSAAAVLELARAEAEQGFRLWRELGFWFPPEDSHLFIRAIAGDAGHNRVRQVAGRASE